MLIVRKMGELIEDSALRNRVYVFEDRFHAGERLAQMIKQYVTKDAYILAIPAGGVPVGYVLSDRLKLPLDVIVVRKIHIPWNQEAGFGAISWDGIILFNEPLLQSLDLTEEEIIRQIALEKEAINRRIKLFRGNAPFPDLTNRTVIITDDGLASGYTMLAAVKSIKKRGPKEIIVAVPTGSRSAIELLISHVDKLVCLNIRAGFSFAVADAYKSWYDLEEEDVTEILKKIHKG